MLHYLNLSVVLRYDFIVTFLAVIFFIQCILANLRLKRFRNVFWRVWESRNRHIRYRRIWQPQNSNKD